MTDTYSADRASIVAFLRKHSTRFTAVEANDLADMIERGDDLAPVKPKATIADLLALHDLDLGALTHVAGVIGDDLDDGDVRALCDKYQSVNDWHELVADVLPSHAATWDARQFSALGAKVRAALSAPTIKVAMPRVLQSADEAPCGSLMQCNKGVVLLRLWDGTGWRVDFTGALHKHACGWTWTDSQGRVSGARLIAEGLTETECRHLSGLSAADAIAWCERRARLLAK